MRRGRAVAGIYSLPRAEVETGTRGWMDVLLRAVRRVAYLATGASPTLAVACAASALGGTATASSGWR